MSDEIRITVKGKQKNNPNYISSVFDANCGIVKSIEHDTVPIQVTDSTPLINRRTTRRSDHIQQVQKPPQQVQKSSQQVQKPPIPRKFNDLLLKESGINAKESGINENDISISPTPSTSPSLDQKSFTELEDSTQFASIDPSLRILFDNALFNKCYIPFLKAIAHYGGKQGNYVYLLHFIHIPLFEAEMLRFGAFDMSRCDEFKRILILIIEKSKPYEPHRTKSHDVSKNHTTFVQALDSIELPKEWTLTKIDAVWTEWRKDDQFLHLLHSIFGIVVENMYYKMCEDCFVTLATQISIGFTLKDPLRWYEFAYNIDLRAVFAEFVAVNIDLLGYGSKQKQFTRDQVNHLKKTKNLLHQYLPRTLTILNLELKTAKRSRIDFNVDAFNYLRYTLTPVQ